MKISGDIQSKKLIVIKGFLFALVGALGVLGIWLQVPDWRTALLLVITIWACCRFYYFAFYVIEHYVDEDFKFAGLWAMLIYLAQKRKK